MRGDGAAGGHGGETGRSSRWSSREVASEVTEPGCRSAGATAALSHAAVTCPDVHFRQHDRGVDTFRPILSSSLADLGEILQSHGIPSLTWRMESITNVPVCSGK